MREAKILSAGYRPAPRGAGARGVWRLSSRCRSPSAAAAAALNGEFVELDAGAAVTQARRSDDAAVLPSQSADAPSSYKIGHADVLEISVFKVPELARTVEVAETGTINLPLLGDVSVAGKSVRDIERELAKKLEGKYLRAPQVTVTVEESNSQRVTVDGAVKKPGAHALKGQNYAAANHCHVRRSRDRYFRFNGCGFQER